MIPPIRVYFAAAASHSGRLTTRNTQMRIVFFEDIHARDFTPLAQLRPVFELLCGCFSARERVLRHLPTAAWGALVRPELAELYRSQQPAAVVNDPPALEDGPSLLVNGRWLADPSDLERATVGIVDDQIAWVCIDPAEASLLDERSWHDSIQRIASVRTSRVAAAGVMLRYPWDLVSRNRNQLIQDIPAHFTPANSAGDQVAMLGPTAAISIDNTAQIDPFVVIDARSGPVRIEANARIQSFTRIEGPCFVGRESQLFRALVRGGTTIGPVCRIGGEIEETIFHGYANKYHEGFVGHSYVCPWVNIGAIATTSDLRNDYGPISVPLDGEPVPSGCNKLGSFIGDHARVAVDSMFNAGSSVGVMATILPGGSLLPTYVPAFAQVWFGNLADRTDLARSLETARIAMSRRGVRLSTAEQQLLEDLYRRSSPHRVAIVEAAAIKRAARNSTPPLSVSGDA